jgi:hypothetical protein
MPDLGLPGAVIARKLVNENDRRAASGLLVIEPDPVVGGQMRHGIFCS